MRVNYLSEPEKPTVTVNCSGLIILYEGDDLVCVCKDKEGIPAPKVTWYKEKIQIGETEKEEQTLALKNVDGSYGGIYKCVAQKHTLTDEKSIKIFVYRKYIKLIDDLSIYSRLYYITILQQLKF